MGRSAPGDYGNEWTPPTYTVDRDGKVVGGYEPREPNNWGRWGDDDQRGTQNLIGAGAARGRRRAREDRQGLLAGAADRRDGAEAARRARRPSGSRS